GQAMLEPVPYRYLGAVIVRPAAEVMLVDIAEAGIVRPLKSGRQVRRLQRIGGCLGRVGILGAEIGAQRDGVQVAQELTVDTLVELIRHFEHGSKADVLLHAETRAAVLRERRPSPPHSNAGGTDQPAGAGQIRYGSVIRGWLVPDGRLARHAIHLIAVEPVV